MTAIKTFIDARDPVRGLCDGGVSTDKAELLRMVPRDVIATSEAGSSRPIEQPFA
jgi:hypothetical protein